MTDLEQELREVANDTLAYCTCMNARYCDACKLAARLCRRADLVAKTLFAHDANRPDCCPLCRLAGPFPTK